MTRKTLILCALLAACGDNGDVTDGGSDATTDATTTKDVAPDNAVKDSATDAPGEAATDASDAGQDAPADAPVDAIDDAPVDAPFEANLGCDGGCTKFSFECSNAQQPCECLGLANGQTGPVCDAAPANCFVDPCQTKSVQCMNNVCVVQ